MIIVTGSAGFIGSNFVLNFLAEKDEQILSIDKLSYAGNLRNLDRLQGDSRHLFVRGDICDSGLVARLFSKYQPRAIIHFAAESHVDRSISSPEEFIQTNIVGTFRLLHEANIYWTHLSDNQKQDFRFLHIS